MRLVAIAVVTTSMVLGAIAAITVWQVSDVTDHALRQTLADRLSAARSSVDGQGRLTASSSAAGPAYAQVLDADGRVVSATPTLTGDAPLLSLGTARRGVEAPRFPSLPGRDIDLAAVAQPLLVAGRPGGLVVAMEAPGYVDARHHLLVVLLIGVPLVVVLTGALTWTLTGRAVHAVTLLAEEADALSVSDSDRGLAGPAATDPELARLVEALNRMLARLGTHYSRNLAAASETTHRLRTPLATLRAEAELALEDPDPAAARAALRQIIGDADRLTLLVDQLLSAAGNRAEICDIAQLTAIAGEEWSRQARAHDRELRLHVTGDARLDRAVFRSVGDPLVENAIRHARDDDGVVSVRVAVDGSDLQLSVTDDGDGVPPELATSVFEPGAGQGHTGLGLWLAREAARAAGGDVWCEQPGPPMTTFAARLPTVP